MLYVYFIFCFKYYSKLLNKINDLAKLKKELFEENNINNLKITDNKILKKTPKGKKSIKN